MMTAMSRSEIEAGAKIIEEASDHLAAVMQSELAEERQIRHFLPDELAGFAVMLRGMDAPINVTGIERSICEEIARRQKMGIQKYGTTVSENPLELRQWLQHAYEEALDQAIYLKRAIEEIDRKASQ